MKDSLSLVPKIDIKNTFEVSPRSFPKLSLLPFRASAQTTMQIINRSNSRALFRVTGFATGGACYVEFDLGNGWEIGETTFPLVPNEVLELAVRLTPPPRATIGLHKTHFDFTVQSTMLVSQTTKLIQRSIAGHLISAPLIGPGTLIGLTLSLLLLVGLLFPQTFRPTAAPPTEIALEVPNSESWYISDFDAKQFERWLAAQKSVVATAEPASEINAPFRPRHTGSLTYEAMFKEIGARYGLDWRLLASLAYRESTLNPKALGKDNDMGLMQIIPDTWDLVAPRLGLSDPFDSYSSALAGASFLAYLRDYFAALGYPDERYFLVAYNWGPRNVEEILNKPGNWDDIPPANQQYAIKILELRNATFPPGMMERLQHLVEP